MNGFALPGQQDIIRNPATIAERLELMPVGHVTSLNRKVVERVAPELWQVNGGRFLDLPAAIAACWPVGY